MEDIFNLLSSSARIDKSKRRKLNTCTTPQQQSTTNTAIHGESTEERNSNVDVYSSNDNGTALTTTINVTTQPGTTTTTTTMMKSRDRTGKRDTSDEKLQQIHREEIAAFRRRMNIKLRYDSSTTTSTSTDIPDPISSFSEMTCPTWWEDQPTQQQQQRQSSSRSLYNNLYHTILRNIEMGKWMEPTSIQMQLIPLLLYGRMDCIGCATTGSGKTGAFLIPAIVIASTPHHIFYNTNVKNDDNYNVTGHNKEQTTAKQPKRIANDRQLSVSSSPSLQAGEIRVLIVVPSHELASQIHREAERLGHGKPGGLTCLLLKSSKSISNLLLQKQQSSSSSSSSFGGKHGIDILITTPLRLCDAIQKGLSLNMVRFIVLDEADRLLDATDTGSSRTNRRTNGTTTAKRHIGSSRNDGNSDSDEEDDDEEDENEDDKAKRHQLSGTGQSQTFLSQMDIILNEIPATAIRALFSATVTSHVRQLSESILRNPMDVTIGTNNNNNSGGGGANPDIEQELLFVGREEGKLLAIRQLVARGQLRPPVIVFVQSQERAQALFTELLYDNIHVDVIHAGRSKTAREQAVTNFRKGTTWVLICTDLIARGVDFRAVNMVINFDLPTSGVTYVHRIGRTGRAGRKGGKAITLFTEVDFDNVRMIANVMKQSGCTTVPDWILQLKKKQQRSSSNGGNTPIRRPDIDTTPSYDKMKLHKKQQMIKHNQEKKKM